MIPLNEGGIEYWIGSSIVSGNSILFLSSSLYCSANFLQYFKWEKTNLLVFVNLTSQKQHNA